MKSDNAIKRNGDVLPNPDIDACQKRTHCQNLTLTKV
jgi:hypothetical protein